MKDTKSGKHTFFEHTECEYYPCHEGIDRINCLFCFCPLYHRDDCPGSPDWREKDGRRIKSCVNCTFPHREENYALLMECLKNRN